MLILFLPVLAASFIQHGYTMECYKSKLPYERGSEHENSLPTETCNGRCYIRSNKLTPKEILRGCTEGFTELPNTGCYIYPNDVWCLCDENRCNFGPIGNGEFEQPHLRMTRSVPEDRVGLKREKRSFQHTLRNPFVESSEYDQFTERRDPDTDRNLAVENLGVGILKNDSNDDGKFSIPNNGTLATDWPKVALRMGQIAQTNRQSRGKFSLHENSDKRYRGRKGKRNGSIFTRDGRIVHHNDQWEDKWDSHQHGSSWRSSEEKNEEDNYSPKSWDDRRQQQSDSSVLDKNGRTVHPRQNNYKNKKKKNNNRSKNNPNQFGNSWEKENKKLESWESDRSNPIEIDEGFWDFEALAGSYEKDSRSIFPKSARKKTTKTPRYRTTRTTTTRRPRHRQTTTITPAKSISRQWNYKKPTSPSRNTGRRPPGRSSKNNSPTTAKPRPPTNKGPNKKQRARQQSKNKTTQPKTNNLSKTKQPIKQSKDGKNLKVKSNSKTSIGNSKQVTTIKSQGDHKDVRVHIPTTKKPPKATTKKTTAIVRQKTTPAKTSLTKTTQIPITVKERTAKAEKQKSAIRRGSNSPLPDQHKVNAKCVNARKLHIKGCKNNPLRIITHSPKVPPSGLTATTLQSVLQTALHLNTSTLAVHVNDTNTNGTRTGQSDGYVGLSHSSRLDFANLVSLLTPIVIGLLTEIAFNL